MTHSRRNFIAFAGALPFAAFAARSAHAADAACYNPATLPFSQRNRRRSIGYVELSSNPKQRCGLCAFFKSEAGDCGTCEILSGGPVTAKSYCTSFAAKAG